MHNAGMVAAPVTRSRTKASKMECGSMAGNDKYLVRVATIAGATGSFVWEICQGDGLAVIKRSTTTFPTRVEALLDSARNASALALEVAHSIPFPFV